MSKLHDLIKTGDIKELINFLQFSEQATTARDTNRWNEFINDKDTYGISPIFYAVIHGQVESVTVLISKNADISLTKNYGRTPLHCAVEYGNVEIVNLLIQRGAPINAKDVGEWTPLFCAAQANHSQIASILIDNKADLESRDKDGWTPLLCSIIKESTETALTLISRKANVNAIDFDKSSALIHAARIGIATIVHALINKGAHMEEKDSLGQTALIYASQNKNSEIALALIANNANVNAKDKNSMSPLHFAASNGCADIAEYLISKNADLMARDKFWMTPLFYAASNGYRNILRSLIANGADFLTEDIDGWTPLHYATINNHTEIVIKLINQGTNGNLRNRAGITSIYFAAREQNTSLMKYLLSLPNIQVNEIGPQSLLCFYHYPTEMSVLLRSRGVLEHRANLDGTINYNARGQSIHSARTEETVKQTFDALMQAHNPGINPGVIENAYLDFQNFLASDTFSQLAEEISEDLNGFGSDAALHAAVNALKPNERYNILMRDIPGIIQRVNNPANSQDVKDNFKKAISLVWLTLQQDEGWEALKGLMTEDEKAIERHRLMLTFIKGLFDIQHEYFNEGNSLKDAPHAACAPGTVNHTLAIFSQQHDKILVTDIEPTPVYDPNSPIKEQLMADDYQRLIEILKISFAEGFKDLEEALSGSSDTIPVLTKEMIDTFFRPNYTNRAIEGRLILIPEHTKLLESLLGKVKEQFYTQLNGFNVPNNPRMIIDAFIELEDALDQMPVQRLAQAITPPAAALILPNPIPDEDSDLFYSCNSSPISSPILFCYNNDSLAPTTKEQAYLCCQTNPKYIEGIIDRLTNDWGEQGKSIFKQALEVHAEYLNEDWFTALPKIQQEIINELIHPKNDSTKINLSL